MSDREDFLARWSRRKREAAEKSPGAAPDEAPAAAPEVDLPVTAPSVDLAALPPIDQITAATDIRGYLAPGVPAELTRAALRRAWVADPAIRDFVGIAENQWDFNDPHGVPGFGPIEDVGRLVARVLGEDDGAPTIAPTPVSAPESHENLPPSGESAARHAVDATAGDAAPAASGQPAPTQPDMSADDTAVAPQHDDDDPPASNTATRRGHGSALPR